MSDNESPEESHPTRWDIEQAMNTAIIFEGTPKFQRKQLRRQAVKDFLDGRLELNRKQRRRILTDLDSYPGFNS